MADKQEQKRAALAKWVSLAEYCLSSGVRSLRYWCIPHVDLYESTLESHHKTLVDMTGDKKIIMEATTGVEDTVAYMMYLWTENFCGLHGWETDPQYIEKVDAKYMAYVQKVQKSVDAKQLHAPGFDTADR